MKNENRREREKEEMREFILSVASQIITDEGIDQLSIRKIAKIMDYSPSLIYHYFKDKDDILYNYMKSGYKKIVAAVGDVNRDVSPINRLKEMTRNYIEAALNMPEAFMAAQLNNSPEALLHTATLFKGASSIKPALKALYNCLKEIYQDPLMDEGLIELTAQAIAISSLGLIMKLIIESEITDEQKRRLIDFHTNVVVIRIVGHT